MFPNGEFLTKQDKPNQKPTTKTKSWSLRNLSEWKNERHPDRRRKGSGGADDSPVLPQVWRKYHTVPKLHGTAGLCPLPARQMPFWRAKAHLQEMSRALLPSWDEGTYQVSNAMVGTKDDYLSSYCSSQTHSPRAVMKDWRMNWLCQCSDYDYSSTHTNSKRKRQDDS